MSLLIIKNQQLLELFNQVTADAAKEKQNRLSDNGIVIHNSCDQCAVCLEGPSIDNETGIIEPFIKHHVEYFPQKIAYVHDACHKKIHATPNHYLIQYGDGDSKIFYDNQKALLKKIPRSIYQ